VTSALVKDVQHGIGKLMIHHNTRQQTVLQIHRCVRDFNSHQVNAAHEKMCHPDRRHDMWLSRQLELLERGIAMASHSSVTLSYRYHIGWNSSKIILQLLYLLSADPNITDLFQGEHPKILAGIVVGSGKWLLAYKSFISER